MELELVLSFIVASVALAIMPGPDNIFVLTESVTKGYRNGIAISFGLGLGVLIHTLAAATGLSLIIQNSAMAFSIIKYLGALYMFYLAFGAYKSRRLKVNLSTESKSGEKSIGALIRKGFLMNILNPKVSLFFIAFLPQFTSPNGYNITIQMIILGVIFMTQAIIVFSLIALLAGNLTKYVNDSRFWKITKWSEISILSILGLLLMISNK